MNFTDPIPFKCAEYSHDGFFLAISRSNELTIFDSENFTRIEQFQFPEQISQILWSPDDKFIMAILPKSQQIHLRCFDSSIVDNQQEGWTGELHDNIGGIESACWAPDSRQILTFSQNNLRVNIWSLITQSLQGYILNPKMNPPKGIAFTQNKKFAALLERKESKDIIGIYYAGNEWKILNQISIETFDVQDVKWINGDSALLVWDSPLDCQILVYSAATGDLLQQYKPNDVVGLGIKQLKLSPNNSMISAGLFDGRIFLYNNLTALEIASLQHLQKIDLNLKYTKTIFIYQEEEIRPIGGSINQCSYQYVCMQNFLDQSESQSIGTQEKKQDIIKIPQIPKKEIDGFKNSKFENVGVQGPPTGVQKIEWSFTSHYMASKNDLMPTTIWIWDMTTLELASVLIHLNPVKCFKFNPKSNDLYIVTGQGRVYTWSPQGASVIELPQAGFGKDSSSKSLLSKIKWNPNSSNLLLMDKNDLLIGIPPREMQQF